MTSVSAFSIGLPAPRAIRTVLMTGGSAAEPELVRRAQQGDSRAFGELFRRHQGRIYALCLRMVADPGRAEDLTQEAFVRAWTKLDSFRGRSAFNTWLHRLTVNLVLGELRRRHYQVERDADDEELERADPEPRRHDPDAGLDLEQAIAGLPPQARMVFVLHDVEGYRHREIAGLTGLAEGTSKAHLHRARRILRRALRGSAR